MDIDRGASKIGLKQNSSVDKMRIDECSGHYVERTKQVPEEGIATQSGDAESEIMPDKTKSNKSNADTKFFIGGPSSWDPYSRGVDSDSLKASLASEGMPMPIEEHRDSKREETSEPKPEDAPEDNNRETSPLREAEPAERAKGEKTLKDAVEAKNRKSKKKSRSSAGPS